MCTCQTPVPQHGVLAKLDTPSGSFSFGLGYPALVRVSVIVNLAVFAVFFAVPDLSVY